MSTPLAQRLLVLMFGIAIALPGLVHLGGSVFHRGGDILEAENRRATSFPPLTSLAAPARFFEQTSQWMEDHVGFRRPLIELYLSTRNELSLGGADGRAVVGRDGYLFYNVAKQLDDLQGLQDDEPGHLTTWVEGMSRLHDSLSAGGRPALLLMPPNKQTIYTDKLPAYIRPDLEARRAPELISRLEAEGLQVLHPVDELKSCRDRAEVYYRTDTHWTDQGAYCAYRALMTALASRGIAAPVIDEDDLAEDRQPDFQGDLVTLLGDDSFTEEKRTLKPRQSVRWKKKADKRPNRDPRYEPVIYRQDLPGAPTLLVSADSFIEAMLPFLRQSFSEITVIRRHPNRFIMADLEAVDADVVLIEIVERYGVLPIDILADAPKTE